MGRRLLALALVLAASGIASAPAAAQNQQAGAPRPVSAEGSAVDRIMMAEGVARFARETGDVSAMIVAARMIRGVEIKPTDFGGVVSGGAVSGPPSETPARFPSFADYLAEARSMAGGNPVLRAEIGALEAEKDKGIVRTSMAPGAAGHRMIMPPDGKWSFDIVVEARKPAIIAALGDGDTDVNIYVYDSRDALIAQDTSPGHEAVVRWTPTSASRYRVVVRNNGPLNTYTVVLSN